MPTAQYKPATPLPEGTADDTFAGAIVEGLSRVQKTLPCRYFYDARGSELFEDITRLSAYYPTRAETEILARHAGEMTGGDGADTVLVEFGSGSSRKTELVLAAMPALAAYVPIDVSESALEEARQRLAMRFPGLVVHPVVGDFSDPLELPPELVSCRKLGFFPGSTIGNLTRNDAARLLRAMRTQLGTGGRLIIGVDLVKDPEILRLAYNDPEGVTAAFNLNLLVRINNTFGKSFNLSAFRHEAIWNDKENRIEMHLVSSSDQTVNLLGRRFRLRAGETIHTENSHKYTVEGFRELARAAGWKPRQVWRDEHALFSVHELVSA
jgi:dimethylhistidine N-methyltransferase